jgi:nucleoside 2-deoxyribosyltransferase
MIMPFDAAMDSIYRDVIRPAASDLGIQINRAADFFTTGEIIEDIWRRLNEASFVIADLTNRNPNVFYELGLAHAIGKPVILLTQNLDDVPFDVRHTRVILYGTRFDEIGTMKKQLENSIRALLDELETNPGFLAPARE